jgi:hypothetical protein
MSNTSEKCKEWTLADVIKTYKKIKIKSSCELGNQPE